VCDLQASGALGPRADAFRRSCALWAEIVPTLNRAAVIPAPEVDSFERATAAFFDSMAGPFPWLRIAPKLHALRCHAPPFLRRFGSLGRYSEQTLEALHGQFNRDAERCTAPTLLGSCGAYVQLSALGRAPGADTHNNGPRPKPAAPRASAAKRTDDRRTRSNKLAAELVVSTDAFREKQAADMAAWAEGLAKRATATIQVYNRRLQRRRSKQAAPMDGHAADGGGQGGADVGGSGDAEGRAADGLLEEADMDIFMGLLGWSFPGRE